MKDSFTPTEVGLLVESFRSELRGLGTQFESLRSEFKLFGEKVVSLLPLREEVTELKEEVASLGIRVGALELAIRDVFRSELPSIKTRLSQLETKS